MIQKLARLWAYMSLRGTKSRSNPERINLVRLIRSGSFALLRTAALLAMTYTMILGPAAQSANDTHLAAKSKVNANDPENAITGDYFDRTFRSTFGSKMKSSFNGAGKPRDVFNAIKEAIEEAASSSPGALRQVKILRTG